MFGIRSSIDYFRMRSRFSQILVLFGHRHWYPKGEDMMTSFKRRKMDHSIFCLERSTPCGWGAQAGCLYFDCQAPDKTKVVPPWGPERANQDRRVGMLNECQGIVLDTSLEVCDCWLVNTCTLIDLIDFSQFLGKGRCLYSQYRTHVCCIVCKILLAKWMYPQIPIACFPDKTWMIFKMNFRTLPRLLPGYFAPEAVGIPTAFGWAECQDGGIRRGNISEWLSLWHLPETWKCPLGWRSNHIIAVVYFCMFVMY